MFRHWLTRHASAQVALIALLGISAPVQAAGGGASHAVTIHATPKYPADYEHFDYVDPQAPKGGELKLAAIGNSFDNLNPYTLKGIAAAGISNTFDTLTLSSMDEPNTAYGLVAETIEVATDGASVQFHLRPSARFHDGSAITADDVAFTFDIIKTKGHPFYRAYYADVMNATALNERTVKFTFKDGTNHELPAIVGQLPVLSRAYWEGKDFSKTTLEAPLGSGPYRVTNVDAGRSITYERVKDYWAQDLPVRRGQNNFDRIHYDYYRDQTVALEAFKAGNYDFRRESSSKLWATGYESPALDAGWVKKELIPHSLPAGMQAFIFNTRREIFRDPKVRRALAYAFDFEWTNKTLFYGQYARSNSFFTNSELASSGTPGADELAVLEKYRGKVPDEVFSTAYTPPTTDGSGNLRSNLRKAIKLLKEAGWSIKDKKLTHAKTGKVMAFEMLLVAPAFERIVLPLQKNFERLGIDMKVRTVDQAQYKSRSDDFDFDVIVGNFGITLSPGNEQRDFWHSSKAQLKGSRNLAGVNDPVVDDLIDLIVSAPDREALVTRTKAFDRVLLWSHYVIPNWHTNKFRVAHWDYFGRPEVDPAYALGVMTWWVDDTKKQAVRDARDKN